jgi:hypothetical protein
MQPLKPREPLKHFPHTSSQFAPSSGPSIQRTNSLNMDKSRPRSPRRPGTAHNLIQSTQSSIRSRSSSSEGKGTGVRQSSATERRETNEDDAESQYKKSASSEFVVKRSGRPDTALNSRRTQSYSPKEIESEENEKDYHDWLNQLVSSSSTSRDVFSAVTKLLSISSYHGECHFQW